MGCLDRSKKIGIILKTMRLAESMIQDDSLRPEVKNRARDELQILKKDIRLLYVDLFNIIEK